MVSSANTAGGHELVIGLVGAIGVDLDRIADQLKSALKLVNYETRVISLIEPVLERHPKWLEHSSSNYAAVCHLKMDIGNELRRFTKQNDILAVVAMGEIRRERRSANTKRGSTGEQSPNTEEDFSDRPVERCVYVLKSLKTKEEASTLRRVYGDNCLVMGVYASESSRRSRLEKEVRKGCGGRPGEHPIVSAAAELIERDGDESGETFGQNVKDTFCMADVFVNADEDQSKKDIGRLIELVFSHPFHTPSRDENAMFHAFGASRRSSSAHRQVGAVIANRDGDVLATGVNEVAKAFGGQYWEGDNGDGRDRETDSSAEMNNHALEDLIERLKIKKWLSEVYLNDDVKVLVQKMRKEGVLDPFSRELEETRHRSSLRKRARILDGIEFIRAVHAEMSALMFMARQGIPTKGCWMYVTAFPCHECAKHIVASGIEQVIFIEPYPKSRVADLFGDSVSIDASQPSKVHFRPFLGIAPRQYMALFSAPKRLNPNGSWLNWDSIREQQKPRLGGSSLSYIADEKELVTELNNNWALICNHFKFKSLDRDR